MDTINEMILEFRMLDLARKEGIDVDKIRFKYIEPIKKGDKITYLVKDKKGD